MILLLLANVIANIPGHLPDFELCRDCGVASYAALLLWLTACISLWRGASTPAKRETSDQSSLLPAA